MPSKDTNMFISRRKMWLRSQTTIFSVFITISSFLLSVSKYFVMLYYFILACFVARFHLFCQYCNLHSDYGCRFSEARRTLIMPLLTIIEWRAVACGATAVGCSNLVPPSDAWLRRTDNEATIGCYATRQRWNLRCDGNQWKGTIGVCSHGITVSSLR